jgi:hypothetical protein
MPDRYIECGGPDMGHHDEKERTAEEAAAERIEDEHPADPEQVEEGFETGYDQRRDTPEEELEPNYARGISHEVPPGTEHHGRFSEGQEELPETPEKVVERRFSEGVERSPTSD